MISILSPFKKLVVRPLLIFLIQLSEVKKGVKLEVKLEVMCSSQDVCHTMAEYPAIMEKAQDLGNKLSNAQGEMSPAQWARFERIQMKFAQAAVEM